MVWQKQYSNDDANADEDRERRKKNNVVTYSVDRKIEVRWAVSLSVPGNYARVDTITNIWACEWCERCDPSPHVKLHRNHNKYLQFGEWVPPAPAHRQILICKQHNDSTSFVSSVAEYCSGHHITIPADSAAASEINHSAISRMTKR